MKAQGREALREDVHASPESAPIEPHLWAVASESLGRLHDALLVAA